MEYSLDEVMETVRMTLYHNFDIRTVTLASISRTASILTLKTSNQMYMIRSQNTGKTWFMKQVRSRTNTASR